MMNKIARTLAIISVTGLVFACGEDKSDSAGPDQASLEKPEEAPVVAVNTNVHTLSIANSWGVAVLNTENGALIAGTSHSENYLAIWQLDANRNSELNVLAEVGFHPDSVYWIDWDQKPSTLELLVAAEGRSRVEVWQYSDSDNALTQLAAIATEDAPQTLGFTDLDQDGFFDLVAGPYSGERITILWGMGDSQFKQAFIAAGEEPVYPKITDWNQDGWLDIIWSDWRSDSLRWAENKAQRNFQVHLMQQDLKSRPKELIVGDINQDGHSDLLVALELGKAALILYGDGKGNVLSSERIPSASNGYVTGAIYYDNENKETMLALAEWDYLVIARRSNSNKAWSYWRTQTLGSIPTAMQFQDIDKDQNIDLIFANSSGKQIEIHFGPIWEKMQPLQF